MTDQEINIAIAESVGWQEKEIAKKCSCPDCQGYECCRWDFTEMPNYVADLNAMNDVETCLEGASVGNYGEELLTLTQQECMPVWNATSRQRAEAYLKTIGKWREGV